VTLPEERRLAAVTGSRYVITLADLDSEDWQRPGVARIVGNATPRGRSGGIVLLHDGGGDRSETVRALRHVLPDWKHRGYTTVPLVVPPGAKKRPRHTATPSASAAASPSASPSTTSSP
jgi:peptidoglycan/xylan/chitin deacetylase (PgdA/CDA1 family)